MGASSILVEAPVPKPGRLWKIVKWPLIVLGVVVVIVVIAVIVVAAGVMFA